LSIPIVLLCGILNAIKYHFQIGLLAPVAYLVCFLAYSFDHHVFFIYSFAQVVAKLENYSSTLFSMDLSLMWLSIC
jgi:hypothetical protein